MTINVKRYFKLFSIAFLIAATISAVIIYKNGLSDNQKSAPRLSIEEKAENGDSISQYELGKIHFATGSMEKAFYYYKLAAEQGLAKAQNNVGTCYYNGDCAEENIEKAIKWYEKAAIQGEILAQANLSNAYLKDNKVEKDYKKSLEWAMKSAAQGSVDGETNLGHMYFNGLGIDKDYKKAFEWNTKAASKGSGLAQYNLATAYVKGDGAKQNFTLAGKLYKKASDNGFDSARKYIEKTSELCINDTPHKVAQVEACLMSAGAGVPDAQRKLVSSFYKGDGTSKNPIEAFAWGFTFLTSQTKDELKGSHQKAIAVSIGLMLHKMNKDEKKEAKAKAKEYVQEYSLKNKI